MKQHLVFASLALLSVTQLGADWTQFRGSDANGISAEKLPVKFDISDGTNIAWTVDLPGRGLSGPIVIGDRVYLTASSGFRQDRLHVLCINAQTGATIWHRQFLATGRTMSHPKMCNATPQPASDGERIFAFFSSNDLICLDLDGNLQWYRGLTHDFPNASNSLGMASSPVVVGNQVVVQVENASESFATAMDVETGEQTWKIDRPVGNNWTSPTVLSGRTPDEKFVVLQSGENLIGYDPKNGQEVWNHSAECATIPSATVVGDMLYVPSQGLTALRYIPDSDAPEVVWQEQRLGPATPSPIVYDGRVYTTNRAGVLRAGDATNGEMLWQLRLKGPFSGTPVIADGKMYLFSEKGLAQVVDLTGKKGELVHSAEFVDTILCTPAAANGALYVRSDEHLWKITEKK